MKRLLKGVLVALMVVSSTVNVKAESTISARVQGIIDNMSPTEKVAQMIQADTRWITPEEVAELKIGSILSGGGAAPSTGNKLENWAASANSYQKAVIDANGIPLLYGIDAVHGNNNLYGATIYPHNIGLGAANDADLVTDIGKAVTSEVRAMGANWTFTPTLGVPHNERWGRTYETFGDDVDRVNALGNAYIKGIESDGSTMATGKHYLGEGLTTNGTNQGNVELSEKDYQDLVNANMDNPTVKEILTPYITAINNGVDSIMVSYNSINGKKCHGNEDVITTLLKEKLGFKGIVISDYNGLDQIEGQDTYAKKAVACVNAGVDMLMVAEKTDDQPRWKVLYNALVTAANDGSISTERLNDAVARILTAKENLGLSDDPSKAYASTADKAKFGGDDHRALARKAVSESLVLLKNDEVDSNKTMMQALGDMKNIVVAGSGANNIGKQCGGWTITWQGATGDTTEGTTIFSGLKAAMEAKNGKVTYSLDGNFTNSDKKIEAAVVVVGENPYAEGYGDRTEGALKLPSNDIATINNIKNTHPDMPIVLVLETGRPIAVADFVNDSQIKGIVNAWLPGSEGAGVADVLLGDKDFVGTNPITWTWYPQDITNKNDETKVLYPVGYGLTKNQKTGESTAPEDPSVIDLTKTDGKIEAENFLESNNLKVQTNGDVQNIGELQIGSSTTYRIRVPKKAAYKVNLQVAKNADLPDAFQLYLDGKLVLDSGDTFISNTQDWGNFTNQEMPGKASLLDGVHELKFVSTASGGFNIDYFQFTEAGEYVEIVPDDGTNVGTGAILKDGAVEVSMSSSENSQSMDWYKQEFEISNKNASKDALDIRAADDSRQTTIVVDDKKTYQEVLGMGTSVDESTIYNLMKMDKENRTAFIKRLLDPVNGMGMTLMRVTVATADFTAQDFYTYYDGTGTELDGKPDWENKTGKGFSIQKDIDLGIIDVIKEMQSIAKELGVEDNLKFFASSWTPPGWMKAETSASKSYANNELLLKGGSLKDEHINDVAKYMVRFVEEYQKEGIPIYAMTMQNEPLLEINYPSCAMTGKQEAKMAKAIKEELKASTVLNDLEKDVKIWAFDHNFNGADNFMKDFFKEAGDDWNIDGIAFHPYGGSASTMGAFYEKYKDKLTMNLTERSVWGTSGANDIIDWLRNGSESYNSWVTMLDSKIQTHHWTGTPDPTLFVQDANNPNNYWATPEVYIMSQFSKYITPGMVRIDTNNGSSSTVTNVAFKDPKTGKIVMVVTNRSGKDQKFKVAMNGTQFNAVLPAGNVATYIWDAKDADGKGLTVPGTFGADQVKSSANLKVNEDGTLGNLTAGATADYLIDVKEAGTYNVLVNVATSNANDKTIELKAGDTVLGSTVLRKFTDTDAWTTYKQVQIQVKLEKGLQKLTLSVPDGSVNIKDFTFEKAVYSHDIPGKIMATDYCDGNGVIITDGYVGAFDTTADWQKIDYVSYRLNVQKDGTYPLVLEYSTAGKDGNFWLNTIKDGIETEDPVKPGHTLKATANAETFSKVVAMNVELKAGETVIKFTPNAEKGFNLKSLSLGSYIDLSAALEEGKLDSKEIIVNLTDGKFVTDLTKGNWSIEGLPAGIDFDVKRDSDTKATITLKDSELVDYDSDRSLTVKVDAKEIGDKDYAMSAITSIKADNDEESLKAVTDVAFKDASFDLEIEGGKFNQDLKVSDLELSEEVAGYVNIKEVKVDEKGTKATITLDRKVTNYNDIAGSVSVKTTGYSDGSLDLTTNIKLLKTNDLPEAIDVLNDPVALSENKAYSHKGTLVNGAKGDYVDFYLGIKEAGNYVLTYTIGKNDAGVDNALKLSGGLGLATDNLASVTIGHYYANLGYAQMLSLKEGDQTLRFEVNNPGFSVSNIKIVKLGSPVEVGKTATVAADKVINGSTEFTWGIEGTDNKNIGYNVVGSYQDYYVDVKEAGDYSVKLNYSHNSGGTVKAVIKNVVDGKTTDLGTIDLTDTGGWSTYKDSAETTIRLSAGKQIIRIYDDVNGFNYRNFQLTLKEVVEDTEKPVITGEDTTIYVGDTTDVKELLGLKVTDNVDGDLLAKAEITGDFDANKAGTYKVTVTVSDASGNSDSKEFTITVVNYASMEIEGDNTLTVGDTFDPMAGIQVFDIDGTNITTKVNVLENNVDTSKAGTYKVVYSVIDKLGNEEHFTRTIVVEEKATVAPNDPIPSNPKPTEPQKVPGEVVTSTKTGDEVNMAGLVCLFALTGLGCLLLKKKKYVNR